MIKRLRNLGVMALTITMGTVFNRPELRPVAEVKRRPADTRPPSGEFLVPSPKRPSDRQLDWIADRIYQRACALQEKEHQQLVRLAAAIQFRAELARLKEDMEAGIGSLSVR